MLKSALTAYRNRDALCFLALGYSSGVPFLLILGTLSFRLAESGVSTRVIGWMTWVTFPYAVKFLWGPYLENHGGRLLNTRKRRCLAAQAGMICALAALGLTPADMTVFSAFWATLAAFCAATQDLLADSIRLDITPKADMAAIPTAQAAGFRLGMLASGAGTLYIAHTAGWEFAYIASALTCVVGMTAAARLPCTPGTPRKTGDTHARIRILAVLRDLGRLPGIGRLVLFCFGYKCADSIFNGMAAPFLHDLGFDKIEYANFSKSYGIILMLLGSFLTGPVLKRIGMAKTLSITLLLQAVSAILFILQYRAGHDYALLALTMGIENLASGMVATVFIVFISEAVAGLPYAGTTFSTLYATGSFGRMVMAALAGSVATDFGWPAVFALAAAVALACLSLIRHNPPAKKNHDYAA